MHPEDLELRFAKSTAAGRESLRVLKEARSRLTDEQRLNKSFELTEMTRQLMRAGLRADHPEWSEEQLHRHYVNRLLGYHGYSLEQAEQLRSESSRRTAESPGGQAAARK